MERQTQSEAETLQFFDLGTRPDRQLQHKGRITRVRSEVQHSILRLCCFHRLLSVQQSIRKWGRGWNFSSVFPERTENFFREKWARSEGGFGSLHMTNSCFAGFIASFRSETCLTQHMGQAERCGLGQEALMGISPGNPILTT